jgi:hypothetical protein
MANVGYFASKVTSYLASVNKALSSDYASLANLGYSAYAVYSQNKDSNSIATAGTPLNGPMPMGVVVGFAASTTP